MPAATAGRPRGMRGESGCMATPPPHPLRDHLAWHPLYRVPLRGTASGRRRYNGTFSSAAAIRHGGHGSRVPPQGTRCPTSGMTHVPPVPSRFLDLVARLRGGHSVPAGTGLGPCARQRGVFRGTAGADLGSARPVAGATAFAAGDGQRRVRSVVHRGQDGARCRSLIVRDISSAAGGLPNRLKENPPACRSIATVC